MKTASDMAAPVTRGELENALDTAIKSLATKAELAEAIKPLATKVELELWGGALLARMEQGFAESRRDMHAEFARHARAFQEFTQSLIASFDDKYKDLPPRVSALESAVFGNEPR